MTEERSGMEIIKIIADEAIENLKIADNLKKENYYLASKSYFNEFLALSHMLLILGYTIIINDEEKFDYTLLEKIN